MQPHKKNFQVIQFMRGVACVLVVLMHITVTFSETYHSQFLGNIFKFGGSGVDIFFVLSGFIITYTNKHYITRTTSTGKFLKKRAIRIFPIYWIAISFFLILQLVFPSFYRTHFELNIANMLSTYLLLPNHNMVNGVSWTLTNELFFYFLFSLALLIPQKKYIFLLLIGYLIFLLAVPFTSFGKATDFDVTRLIVFPMNIEFLLGILIVLIVDYFPKNLREPCLITGIGLFSLSAIIGNYRFSLFHNEYDRVLLYGLPSFFIILALVKKELISSVSINKLFLKLGDASYSIYLFHLPIVAAFFKIIKKLPITNHLVLILISCGLLAFVCFAGIIIYKKIESPLIKWLNKILL